MNKADLSAFKNKELTNFGMIPGINAVNRNHLTNIPTKKDQNGQ